MKRKPLLLGCLVVDTLVVALVVWLVFAPAPVDPVGWTPPEAPAMTGPYAPNEHLEGARVLARGRVLGPEDVAIDAEGRIYGGTVDGRIVRVTLTADDSEDVETVAETGGRPLGLHFDATGGLWIADGDKGLLRMAPDGALATHATSAAGGDFGFTDDLDVASDGRVYFSDASRRFGVHDYKWDLLESRPWGRLLRYDPSTGETEVLLDDLYFANGIALSADESFVLVNETWRYRVTRYWISGPKAGTSEVFIDNLPGFPDGISSNRLNNPTGPVRFWVACFTVRNPTMDTLHPSPFLKKLVARLPAALQPKPVPYGLVLGLDADGNVVRTLQDPGGETIPQVTSAEEVGGYLYLGNLDRDFMARVAF